MKLDGLDNPNINQTHLPLLSMVVSICGKSAIPLLTSQLSLMNEITRGHERGRGEGTWDVTIFNPMISPIPYAVMEIARRLCCSTDDLKLRSARPLLGGEIGGSIRSCMAYMVKKSAKKIGEALKGMKGSCCYDDGILSEKDNDVGSNNVDDYGNNKSHLKDRQFSCSHEDCPLDPRVDTEADQPISLYGCGTTTATTTITSGEVPLPTRLVLADVVFLDRLPWLWWEESYVKKRLKYIDMQQQSLTTMRSYGGNASAIRQIIPLFIPWLSVTHTLAKLACAKVGRSIAEDNTSERISSSSSSGAAQGGHNMAMVNALSSTTLSLTDSNSSIVDQRCQQRKPSFSPPPPLLTLIELVLTERDNLCSVFAPWVIQYDQSSGERKPQHQDLEFPWEQFIVQWRRVEAAVMNILSRLSVFIDSSSDIGDNTSDGRLEEAYCETLGLCKKISAAVLRNVGGSVSLFTSTTNSKDYSSHFSQRVDLQLRQNEKPAIPLRSIEAEAIQRLRSISDAMKVDIKTTRIGDMNLRNGRGSCSYCTDSDSKFFLLMLLSLCIPTNLRTDALHALSTLTWVITTTTDDSVKSYCPTAAQHSSIDYHGDIAARQKIYLLEENFSSTLKKSHARIEKEFLAAWEYVHFGKKWVLNSSGHDEVVQVVGEGKRCGQTGNHIIAEAEGKENKMAAAAVTEENWVMSKQVDLQLLVLQQHWAAVEELSILVELDNALMKEEKMYDETGSEYKWCYHIFSWSELTFRLRRLVHSLLEQGGCSPRDLVAHQTFLWACEAGEAMESSLVSFKPHFNCLHQPLLQMKEAFFRRVWYDAFNAYDQIVSMPVGGCVEGKLVPMQQVYPNVRGPSLALQYCLRSDILFQMCQGFTDVSQNSSGSSRFEVTISNITACSRQLRLAFNMLVNMPYKSAVLGQSGPTLMECARSTLLKVLSMVQVVLPKFPVTLSLPDLTSGIASVAGPTTERFQVVAKLLLIPAAKWLCVPHEKGLTSAASSTLMFDVHSGCALSLIAAFKLQFCIPADPVDPVRLPAIEESILQLRLSRLDLDIAVRLTSSVLLRGASKRPDISHVKQRRTKLEKECIALRRRSAERPSSATPFEALFNEVHTFATGLGSPEHIARLVHSLVSVFGINGGQESLHQQMCHYLQEEQVWQSAAGAFAERLRQNFTYYEDVTVPILESLGMIRAGLRIIAGAVETYVHVDQYATSSIGLDINPSVPSSPIMFLLGDFPWTCRNHIENKEPPEYPFDRISGLHGKVNIQRDEFSSAVLATCSSNRSGEVQIEFIHAVLKRIQLLLLCGGISSSEGVSEASKIIETYAQQWKYALNIEENRKMEDMGTFSYRNRNLSEDELPDRDFDNDEIIEQAAVYRLFPDFSPLFDVDESSDHEYELHSSGGVGVPIDHNSTHLTTQLNSCNETPTVKNEDLALIGQLHASIFVKQVGRMASTALEETICYDGNCTTRVPWWYDCISALSDTQRTLAFQTSYRAACLLQEERRGKVVSLHSSTLELSSIEERLAASHLFALSTAMELYPSGEQRLVGTDNNAETTSCHLDSTDFYRTPAPAEAVRMSIPLTVLLQSLARLLSGDHFPGNAVLLTLARCTERVRGLSVQSSVAQLLAGAQAVLTKAQAWEDVASQGVSLRVCLKPISQLVIRWRKFELEGWRNLMKAREDRVAKRAMEWWPWIHSLVIADGSSCNVKKPPQGDMTESGGINIPIEVVKQQNVPLKQQQQPHQPTTTEGYHHKKQHGGVFLTRQPSKFYSVDWINASVEGPFCPETTNVNDGSQIQKTSWLWRGFPGATPVPAEVVEVEEIERRNYHTNNNPFVLHSNIFDALDTFLRTATVGEFEGRLHLIRAFSGQLALSSRLPINDNDTSSSTSTGLGIYNKQELSIHQHRLSLLLLRLWRHYQQFSASVKAYCDRSKAPIEKSILNEIKLGRWDDQTYYSLAESSQRTHRKLTRLLKAYDEVLESSVSPILNAELVKGIGEIQAGLAAAVTSMEEVPSPSSVFYVVADIDGEEDIKFQHHYSDTCTNHDLIEKEKRKSDGDDDLNVVPHSFAWLKENIRATSSLSPLLFSSALGSSSPSAAEEIFLSHHRGVNQTEKKLKNLPALCVRMHYLLSSRLFSDDGEGLKGVTCAEVAEDICAAIFLRLHTLRQYDIEKRRNMEIEVKQQRGGSGSSGSSKAVKKRAVLDLLKELKVHGLNVRPQIPWEVKKVDISMALPSPFSLTSLAGSSEDSSHSELWKRADRYFSRSIAELVRLRLEANSTSSPDVTQREAQAMVWFCEDLNLIVLQQRAAIDAAAITLGKFEGIVHAHSSLLGMYRPSSSRCNNANAPLKERGLGLPPQTRSATLHIDMQCRSLLCVLEGLREASLLVRSVKKNRTADLSSKTSSSSIETAYSEEDLLKQLDVAVDVVLGCLTNLTDWTRNEYTHIEVLVTSELTQTLQNNAQIMASLADSLEKMCTTTTSMNTSSSSSPSTTTTTLVPRCVLLRVASELRQATTTTSTTTVVDDVGGGCSNSNSSEEFNDKGGNHSSLLLQEAYEATINELLLAAQRILCHSTRKMNEKKQQLQGGNNSKLLLESQADAYEQLKGICIGLHRSFVTLGTVHALLKKGMGGSSGTSVTGWLMHTTGTCITELSIQVCDGARAVMRGTIAMHKSCAKLQYVLLRVFRTIVVNGLCENAAASAEEEDDEIGSNAGESEKFIGAEGAGMGSGKGTQDVSSDIDEEQLLGMKGEKEDEEDGGSTRQPKQELTKEEAQEGIEMTEDFDGDLYDIQQEMESEEKEGEEEEGEEQQEQMDREMGDVGNMGDIVDQGLWDEHQDEDDSKTKEDYNSSGKMEGPNEICDEIRTKEGEKEENEDEKRDKHQNERQGDGGGSDVVAQVDEDNDRDDDSKVENEMDEDTMSMDGDRDAKNRNPMDHDLFQEDAESGNGDDQNADLPDNMQLDRNDDNDGIETASDHNSMMELEDNDPTDMDVTGNDSGDTVEEEDEKDKEDKDDDDAAAKFGKEEKDEEEAMGNAERGASGGIASCHDQRDEEEEENVGNEEGVAAGTAADVRQTQQHGHKDDEGGTTPNVPQHEKNETAHDDEEQGLESREEGMKRRGETEGGMSYREGTVPNDDTINSAEFKRRNRIQGPEAPNPMKIPGDALNHLERRLNVLQILESEHREKENGEEEESQRSQEGEGIGRQDEKEEEENNKLKAAAYQYARSVNEATTQSLGAATDEDALGAAQQSRRTKPDVENLDAEEKVNDSDGGIVKQEEEEEENLRSMAVNSGRNLELEENIAENKNKKGKKKNGGGGGGRSKPTAAVKTRKELKNEEDIDQSDTEDDDGAADVPFQGAGYTHGEPRDNNSKPKPMLVSDDDDDDDDGHDLDIDERDRHNKHVYIDVEKKCLTKLKSDHVNEWRKLRAITQPLAGRLCERLRLVLMAQVASRLQGDYRSGKRINMKRVIGYVASHFRKDKIWLRRTKPAKRDYQVMLVIDDTQSMKDGRDPLLQAAATAVQALTQLEVGQVGVAAFRSHLNILHSIGDPWTDEAGARVVSGLSFVDRGGEDANVKRILREASTELSKGGMGGGGTMYRLNNSFMSLSRLPPRQLVVLFSDGLFDEAQRNGLRLQIRGMEEKGQLVVLVIIAHDLEEGILTITNWDPEKAISRPYLDDYPFPYYLVLKDVRSLPELLSDALRQWFELASEAS